MHSIPCFIHCQERKKCLCANYHKSSIKMTAPMTSSLPACVETYTLSTIIYGATQLTNITFTSYGSIILSIVLKKNDVRPTHSAICLCFFQILEWFLDVEHIYCESSRFCYNTHVILPSLVT